LCVKGVEALEAFREDFVIGQALLCEAFEDLFNPESFQAMKLIVFQIRIMNEFS
jgi:hypothetical protein